MSTLLDAVRRKAPRVYYVAALAIVIVWGVISLPPLERSRTATVSSQPLTRPQLLRNEKDYWAYSPSAMKVPMAPSIQVAGMTGAQATAPNITPDAAAGLRIVRTASIEMFVQRPVEIADRITAIAEKMGGYLVSEDGQSASKANVTVRVPVAQFEEARAEIRALGVRVESEKFAAEDVTRQYVDQEASIRNLQAQEMQYLAIMKEANNVPNMLGVAEKLSEVRGQIEKLQAQANSSWQQAETVAIAVSLRTDAPQPVSGPDWRLQLHELRTAADDGLASLAGYATTMITILFYLPAALLWTGTIFLAVVLGWRAVQWARRRWLGWTAAQNPIQG